MNLFLRHFFLLLWCCFVSACTNSVSGLNYDGLALMSLLRKWDSVPTSITSSWNSSDSTPCSWLGIGCDHRSHCVVSLNLSGLGISGPLGPEIGQLKRLKTVDLNTNYFSGDIPSQLGNCSLLEYLDLSANSFTGGIPDSFKYLQNLQTLILFSNSLSGEIPESLFQDLALQVLYLDTNKFNGSIPRSVGNLTELLELSLFGNQLSGSIPESIGNCRKLQSLSLSNNKLSGSLPEILTNLESLVELFVSHNSLEGRIPLGFGKCKNLETLDLSFNSYSGGLPPDLGNCSSLATLAIIHSNLRGAIPSSFGQLKKLSVLELSENRLSGTIPPELSNCKSLMNLNLYTNELEGKIPSELGRLNKLEDLELFNNHLSGEIPISIWKIASLKCLLVYNNSLSGELPLEITHLKNLKNLSLYNNQFFGVIPQSLGINSSLLQLDFTDNKFTGEVPPNLCHGKQLRVLNMGRNQLQGSIPSDVGGCLTLWRLILRENNLSGALPEFSENPILYHMDVSKNNITGPIPPSIGNCSGLTSIHLSMNKLTGFIPSELGNLVNLLVVDLSSNQLEGSLPSQLSKCHNLGKFDVGFNSLNGSVPSSLRNWTSLSTLILKENHFIGGIPLFLSELEKLTELQLGGNFLGGEIPSWIGSLQSLQYALNLSSNGLFGELPSELGNLIKLEQLQLSNNNLTGTLAPLDKIHSLVQVDISYNHFSGPIPETLMNLLNSSPSSFWGNPDLCVSCLPSGGLTCTKNRSIKPCDSQLSKRDSFSRVAVVLIAIASVVAVFMLVGLVCMFILCRRCKQDLGIDHDVEIAAQEGPSSLLNKVMQATENLNDRHIVGRGTHGTVYKASLGGDKIFAVKKIVFTGHKGGNKSMVTEIQTIGKIRHRNLLKLELPFSQSPNTNPLHCSSIYCYRKLTMEVQITSRKLLKPSVQTPPHLQILKLSILDQYPYYVPNIFYYTNANHEIENINTQKLVEQLEKSLLEVLTLFYPLAGRFIKDKLIVDCNDDGVEFLEAKADGDLTQILQQEPKPYELLRRLVPSLAESATSPLLAIQVNIFRCGGLAIGVLNSHRIAGRWTMSRFINAWATTHFHDQGISKVTPPTFVSPFIFPDSSRLSFPVPPPRMASKKIVAKIFRFDREAIEKLKSEVISGADSGVKHHPSRVEVVSALIWKALISVAKEKHGYLRSSSMSLPFNLRGKVGVPLDNQCGNLCRPIIARFDAKNQSKLVLSELVSLIGDAKRRAS